MIRKIQITNFKSYQNATFPLGLVTFLIGANASGKSNALESLRFLWWLGRGMRFDEIERTIKEADKKVLVRGKPVDLFRNPDEPFKLALAIEWENTTYQFSIEIGFLRERLFVKNENFFDDAEPQVSRYKIVTEPKEHSDEIAVAYDNFKPGKKPHLVCSSQHAVFYQLLSPTRFSGERAKTRISRETTMLRDLFSGITFLDAHPADMRGYAPSGDTEMNENGSNLASVLQTIYQDPDKKEAILDFIRSLPEQEITGIHFITTSRNDVIFQLEEKTGSETITRDAPLLSDGTMRVLAIGATLLSAKENSLVVIEEIDNGVHPSRARHLVESLFTLARARRLQLLVTTHNPALLNAIPANAVADVLCCYRAEENGDSRIAKLGDLPRFAEIAATPLGQTVALPVLNTIIHDASTQEDRTQRALDWLDTFQRKQDPQS